MQPVSIISTVLNEIEDIPRLIPCLLAQIPLPAEIVIVDGGSTDGTWEWLVEAARSNDLLQPIRDESCSLKNCPGPVSRGRNVAIAASTSEIVACVDAGCTYLPDWMARITEPIVAGTSEYALGGACLDLVDPTLWDVASAPYFGVKVSPDELSKSCTARSMAFTKDLWKRVGGFPETVLLGDDTFFDLEARRATAPAFVNQAKAFYRPRNSFAATCRQLARYAASDGILGVRTVRLFRNGGRCLLEVAALACLPWTVLPLLAVLAMVGWFAFRADWRFISSRSPRALLARLVFSICVPWIIAINHLRGLLTKKNPSNRQNRMG
jgi:glycosyltransferase involved in cell wall biosynthesis